MLRTSSSKCIFLLPFDHRAYINKLINEVVFTYLFCEKKNVEISEGAEAVHYAIIGWLVVLGFNGPLKQYFSLYRAVFPRLGERGQKGYMRVKMSIQPHPHLLQVP